MTTIITLPPPLTQRLGELRRRFDLLDSAFGDLRIRLTQATATPDENRRSTTVHERDLVTTLVRLETMAAQAARELDQARVQDAIDTLSAADAILRGELLIRLRVWVNAENNPAARDILIRWLDDLTYALENTPC